MAAIPEGFPFEIEDVAAEFEEKRIVAGLLADYCKYLELQVASLKRAARSRDRREIHRLAHAIRGSALTIGASALARAAENLEKVNWDIDSSAVGGYIAEVAARARELGNLPGGRGIGIGN